MASKTIATQYFMKSYNDFMEARKAINKLGVLVSNDENVLIFTSGKKNSNCYTRECNGLVLEKNTYRILAVPPRNLVKIINFDSVNRLLYQGLYKIYRINEGTIINFYYYNDEWVLSTTNGCNVANTKWEEKTYKEMIMECLEKYGIEWNEFLENLNKKSCYSFGFKHPDIHKFKEESQYKIWFVHSINLDESDNNYLWAINTSPIPKIPSQEEIENVGDVRELFKIANDALENYINDKKITYGFIMRSVNVDIAGNYSDILIESSLLKTIRFIWYDKHINRLCFDEKLEKETIIPLFAYLDQRKYENFNLLFPEYKNKMELISNELNNTSDVAVKLINGEKLQNKYSEVASSILEQFKKDNIKLDWTSKNDAEKKKLFHSYMCHCSFMYYLLPLIQSK